MGPSMAMATLEWPAADKEALQGLVQTLVQHAKATDEAAQVPLAAVQALADGKIDTFELPQLLEWLVELQRRTQRTTEMVQLIALLYDGEWVPLMASVCCVFEWCMSFSQVQHSRAGGMSALPEHKLLLARAAHHMAPSAITILLQTLFDTRS